MKQHKSVHEYTLMKQHKSVHEYTLMKQHKSVHRVYINEITQKVYISIH